MIEKDLVESFSFVSVCFKSNMMRRRITVYISLQYGYIKKANVNTNKAVA